MKVIFLSGALGHFHNEMCKGLYNYLGNDFKFIQTEKIDECRKEIGVSFGKLPYLIQEETELSKNSKELILNCDILIYGSTKYGYIKERIRKRKIVIYYSERLFKKGLYSLLNPKTFLDITTRFIIPARKQNAYLICASAYAPYDFDRLSVFKNRMYKWGYYPKTNNLTVEELFQKKKNETVQLLWVGRLVKLKHADDAIAVMAKLRKNNIKAHLNIIGTGVEQENLRELVRSVNMEQEISFLGAVPVDQTRKYMDLSDIFLFTSDFREGWGATLNEAMNSACAVVASHAAGSTPFLVKHGVNGYVYKSGYVEELYQYVKALIQEPELRKKLAENAYETINRTWNIECASERLMTLMNDLYLNGKSESFNEGPCSKAEIIKPNWINRIINDK